MRAHAVPEYGGDTTWTNLVAAYEGLSPAIRTLVDGLRAEHRFGLGFSAQDQENGYLKHVCNTPLVAIHPVVRVHPETGERAIFVSPGFTSHIVGASRLESRRILDLRFENRLV